MFKELEILCAQIGFQFESVVRTFEGNWVCVLSDRLGSDLNFSGATVEEAVERAVERLVVLTGKVTH